MTESVEVLVAMIASGFDDRVEVAKDGALHFEVLDDRLDHEVAVGEVAQFGRRRDAREDCVGLFARCACPSRPARARDFAMTANMASAVS